MTTATTPKKPHRHDLLCIIWCPRPDKKKKNQPTITLGPCP